MLNAQIVHLKLQGKENVAHKPAIEGENIKKLNPSQAIALLPCFKMCGFMLSCSFVGEEEKARGNSKGQVSNLKLMPLEESSSQWCIMKQPKIILLDLLTSQAMKSWQGCTKPLKKTTVTKPWRFNIFSRLLRLHVCLKPSMGHPSRH